MKKFAFSLLLLTSIATEGLNSQTLKRTENYGQTVNFGYGETYYKYVGYVVPILYMEYELPIQKYITAAPFIGLYKYQQSYPWNDINTPLKYYKYNETVVPIGLKISYYVDSLLMIPEKWDFYISGSLGFVYRLTEWEFGYGGKNQIDPGMGPLYLNFHLGTEYHINRRLGIFLDLSVSMSMIGLSYHLKNN